MNDWVVETPTFEEDLMNDRVVMLNQNGVNRVVEIIKDKDKEIKRLNNIINNDDVYGYIKHLEDLITKKDTIINEFMEELKWQRKVSLSLNKAFTVGRIDVLINCLQELKGDGSNE